MGAAQNPKTPNWPTWLATPKAQPLPATQNLEAVRRGNAATTQMPAVQTGAAKAAPAATPAAPAASNAARAKQTAEAAQQKVKRQVDRQGTARATSTQVPAAGANMPQGPSAQQQLAQGWGALTPQMKQRLAYGGAAAGGAAGLGGMQWMFGNEPPPQRQPRGMWG